VSRPEPNEEELRAAMEEQLRRISVQDVLLQTTATLVSLAGRRLGLAPDSQDERDLEQARLAIEGTRALLPLLSGEEASAVKQALSQLQVAYAREAQAPEAPAKEEEEAAADRPGAKEAPSGAKEAPSRAEEAERAKARSKIWTPPGS
jgi:hypothetical protein